MNAPYALFIVHPETQDLFKKEIDLKLPDLKISFNKPGILTYKGNITADLIINARLIFAQHCALSFPKDIAPEGAQTYVIEKNTFYIIPIKRRFCLEFGATSPQELPPEAPSTAYLKISEAFWRTGFTLKKTDQVLELGCAPGGASYFLLENSSMVWGVDPGQMDRVILNNPNFTFLNKSVQVLRDDDFPLDIDYLICDINLFAPDVIGFLRPIFKRWPGKIFFTVKWTHDMNFALVDKMRTSFYNAGAKDVHAFQLYANKKEFLLYISF
jgi:hypothetical protein